MAKRQLDTGVDSGVAEAPDSLGFMLRLESGKALLELKDKPLGRGVTLRALEMEIPKVKFPFDVTGGAERFHSTRCVLRTLVLQLEHETLQALLVQNAVRERGFTDLEIAPEHGGLVVTGAYRDALFSFAIAPVIVGPRELALLPFDERIYGMSNLPASRIAWTLIDAIGGVPLGAKTPTFDVVALSVRELLPRYGWKIPDTSETGLISAEVAKTGWVIACGRSILSEHKTPSRVSFAAEARAPFEREEQLLYAGEDDKAFTAYRKLIEAEVPHRFAVRRFLQLAQSDEKRYEDGRSVAEEALLHDADNSDALLFLGHYAAWEKDTAASAKYYADAAATLWADKSDRSATLADVRAAQLGAPDVARASLQRALKKRKADRRALQLLFQIERDDDNVRAAASVGEKLLRALPEDQRFNVHLELGEMLLGKDPKKAKLHAERAVRANMEEPRALRLVARVFARSGDVPRAVRYLSRLSERFIAAGDLVAAVSIEQEIAEQLETTRNEDGFDPRALLNRYQRILTLDPSHRMAVQKTAALAFDLGEMGLAKRSYEELAEDPDAQVRSEATYRLGQLALSEGRPLDAEALFEGALFGRFGDDAYFSLAKIYDKRKDTRAQFRLEKMLAERSPDPAKQLDHHLRAAAIAREDDLGAAVISHLEAALAITPSDGAIKHRLLDAIAMYQGPENKRSLLEAWAPAEHEPSLRAEWNVELAALREQAGDLKGAKDALDAAIAADPSSSEANESLYSLSQKLGEPYGAFRALGNLARYRQASEEARAEIRITQAELLAGALGRRDEARAYLLRALIDVPHHQRGLRLLGELAEEAKDGAMAEDAWQRYLETGAEDGRDRALRSLAQLAKARGDLQAQFDRLFTLWEVTGAEEVFAEMRAVLKERGDFSRLVMLLRDATEAADGERRAELQWQTALVLRDSVGDWQGAREELEPLAGQEGHYGDLARKALVDLAREEGDWTALARALEIQLQTAKPEEVAEIRLEVARAYRESEDIAKATSNYEWVIDHDPKNAEALKFLGEQAEKKGNAQLAFSFLLRRFKVGDEEALPSLVRVADTVPTSVLIASIADFEAVPASFALGVAGRLDAEGYCEEAVAALDRALTSQATPESRQPLVMTMVRIFESTLEQPQKALDALRGERVRAPDFAFWRDEYNALVERAGTPGQRAELALERSFQSDDPHQVWASFKTLLGVAPDHDSLRQIFTRVALEPALRGEVLEFLRTDHAVRVVGDRTRADVLLSLHGLEPLDTATLLLVARSLRRHNDTPRSQPLFADLYRRSPEDLSLFAEWREGSSSDDERHAIETTRITLLSDIYRQDSKKLADLLWDAAQRALIGKERLSEIRDLYHSAGDAVSALRVAQLASQEEPEEVIHWIRRAELALEADQPDEVVSTLSQLAEVLAMMQDDRGVDTETLTQLQRNLANALAEREHHAQALAIAQLLLSSNPADPVAYTLAARLLGDNATALLPIARARATHLGEEHALRDWLRVAAEGHDPAEQISVYRVLGNRKSLTATDVEAAFALASPPLLSAVWQAVEGATDVLQDDARRRVVQGLASVGDASEELRATLLEPIVDKTNDELAFLGERLFANAHADRALALLDTIALDRVAQDATLRKLWLDSAVATRDDAAKLRMLKALSEQEGATLDTRLDHVEALVAMRDDTSAFPLLQALADGGELATDKRSRALLKHFHQLLLERAKRVLDSDPEQAAEDMARMLRESPDSEEAWLLSLEAARRTGDDAKLAQLLAQRQRGPEQDAEFGAALARLGRAHEAALAFMAAFEAESQRAWLDQAVTLFAQAGDDATLANVLLQHATGQPDERALLQRALDLFEALGDSNQTAILARRLFEADPTDLAAYERYRKIAEDHADAHALVTLTERRLATLDGESRRALVMDAARLHVTQLFDNEGAEQLLAKEFPEESERIERTFELYQSLNDPLRAAAAAQLAFARDPANNAFYARHRRFIEASSDPKHLFDVLLTRMQALSGGLRRAAALEAIRYAIERLHLPEEADNLFAAEVPDPAERFELAYSIYRELGDELQAKLYARRAFEHSPRDARALRRYSEIVEKNADSHEMFALLNTRLKDEEGDARKVLALQTIRFALDRMHSLDDAEALMQAEFSDETERLTLAQQLYAELGEEAKATQATARLFELNPNEDAVYERRRADLERANDIAGLLAALQHRVDALQGESRATLALEAVHIALQRGNDPSTAKTLLLQYFGDDRRVLRLRITIEQQLGNDVEALALLKGLAAYTENVEEKAAHLHEASRLAEHMGLSDEAAQLWAQGIGTHASAEEVERRAQFLDVLPEATRVEMQERLLSFMHGNELRTTVVTLSHFYEAHADSARALQFARQALQLEPESTELRTRVATLLEKMGQTESLVQLLSEQHASSLDRAERYKLALEIARRAEHELADNDQAEHFYRQAIKDDPAALEPLRQLGRLYGARQAQQELCDTLEAMIPLLDEGEERGQVCMRLGDLRAERNEQDKATLAYLYAFRDGTSSAAARKFVRVATKRGLYVEEAVRQLRHLGEVLSGTERVEAIKDAAEIVAESQQNYLLAAELYREALQAPTREERLRIVEWLERGKQTGQALFEMLSLIDKEERDDNRLLMLKRAQSLAERTDDPDALMALRERVFALGRMGFDEQLVFADELTARGQDDRAFEVLARALDLANTDSVFERIKEKLLARGRADFLIEQLIATKDPKRRGKALTEAARLSEFLQSNIDRAYALYREALAEQHTLDTQDLVRIAAMAESRGDEQTVGDIYLRIAEGNADAGTRAHAYLSMAKLWMKRDSARAEDCLKASLKLAPQNPEASRMLAQLYVEQKRFAEAAPLMEAAQLHSDDGDQQWMIDAASGAAAAGDMDRARQMLLEPAKRSEQAFWTLFQLESAANNSGAVVRLMLDRLDAREPINDAERLTVAAIHAQRANIPQAEERLLGLVVDSGIATADTFQRLTTLAETRNDFTLASRWASKRAETLPAGPEQAEAFLKAGLLERRLGKSEDARHSLEAAFNLAPTSPPVLENLFEIYRELGDMEQLQVVGERMMIIEPSKQRAQSFYLTLAEASAATGTNRGKVLELYALAARDEALPAHALPLAIAAAEAAGRDEERMQWEEERLQGGNATDEEYMRLGVLARDRMQDLPRAERYFRIARKLNPASPVPLHALAALTAVDRNRAQEALDLYRELTVRAPTDPEPYRLLARLYGQAQDMDRTFLYYDALRALDPTDEEADRFVAAAQQVTAEVPPRGLSKQELGAIADAGMLSPVQQFYGPLAAQAELLYPVDLSKLGLTDADQIQLDQGIGRRIAVLMQRMGGRALEVSSYRAKAPGKEAIVEPGTPARLVVSADLAEQPPRVVQFTIARALGTLALGHLLPNRLPEQDASTLLGLLAKRFVPGLDVAQVPADRAAAVTERVRALTADDAWNAHAEIARNFAVQVYAHHDDLDHTLAEWMKAGDRTADRWALLMTGDLSAAFGATKTIVRKKLDPIPPRGPARLQAIAARPDLLALLNFATSDTYLQIRQALGLTLKR